VGADGSLTGYGGGMERKRYLLDLERRVTAASQLPGQVPKVQLTDHGPAIVQVRPRRTSAR
jgi:hypothetical protein